MDYELTFEPGAVSPAAFVPDGELIAAYREALHAALEGWHRDRAELERVKRFQREFFTGTIEDTTPVTTGDDADVDL